MKFKIIFLLVFFINSFLILSSSPVILENELGKYPLGKSLQYFEDEKGDLKIEDILYNTTRNFKLSDSSNLNFGFTNTIVWVKFKITNPQNDKEVMILEYAHPHMDIVNVYQVSEKQQITEFKGGDLFPYSSRQIDYKNISFKLMLDPLSTYEVYLRFQTKGSMQIPLTLWTPIAFAEHINKEQFLFGIYFGIMFAMLLYNAFLFITLRDRNYLFYIIYLLFFILVQLEISRFDMEYLWPNSPSFGNFSFPLFYNLTFLFASLFTRNFLDTKQNTPNIDKILISLISLAILGSCLTIFISYIAGFYIVLYVLAIFEPPILLIAGVISQRRKMINARFFILAWTILIISAFTFNLRNIAILPSIFITDYILYLGSVIEVLFLSLALGDRIKSIEAEKILAQKTAFDAQQKLTNELEILVRQRTNELEITNKKLEELSNIDGLTNLLNRRSFDKTLSTEWRSKRRERKPLTLIMGDIDHFKAYNDHYGHLMGDSCLKSVAEAIQQSLKRPTDLAFRYGGEEFAIVLPGIDSSGGLIVAARISKNIEKLSISHKTSLTSSIVTMSFGIATMIPNHDNKPDVLISKSDESLYKSKKMGRNQITVFEKI